MAELPGVRAHPEPNGRCYVREQHERDREKVYNEDAGRLINSRSITIWPECNATSLPGDGWCRTMVKWWLKDGRVGGGRWAHLRGPTRDRMTAVTALSEPEAV